MPHELARHHADTAKGHAIALATALTEGTVKGKIDWKKVLPLLWQVAQTLIPILIANLATDDTPPQPSEG